LFLLSLALGSVSIPFDQVLLILRGGTPEKASWLNIVLKFRLPKAITASLAGAALGVSGLMMQTFFKNPSQIRSCWALALGRVWGWRWWF
jgi:iron complex transport system permease protein